MSNRNNKNLNKQLRFPIQFFGISQFSISLLLFLMLFFSIKENFSAFSCVFLSLFCFRILIYPTIDHILPKKILLKQGELFLKVAFLKIRLNKETALFVEEDIFVFTKAPGPHTCINFYRNRHRIFRFSFKNKIRLYLEPTEEKRDFYFKELIDLDVKCLVAGGEVF